MPVTRTQSTKMENQLLSLLQEMKVSQDKMEANQEQLKVSQDKMKEEMKDEVKFSLDVMKTVQDKMLVGLEEMKEEIKSEMVTHREETEERIQQVELQMLQVQQDMQQKIDALQHQFVGLKTGVSTVECSPTTSRMKLKAPTFDGKTPWSTYFKQFDAAAMVNGWTDEEKAITLIISLRGEALNILQTIPDSQQKDYKYLVSRLEMRYGDAHLQQVYHAQVKNRVQKCGESLQEFESDVARLVRLAYPTAPDSFLEQLAVQTFVDGLRDSETQQSLRLARSKTLDDALAHALEFEAAKQVSHRQHRVRTAVEESGTTDKEDLEDLVRRILRDDQLKKRGPRCWNCGELGHLLRSCNKPRNATQPSEN